MTPSPAIRFDHTSVRVFAPAKRPTVYTILTVDGSVLYRGATVTPRRRLHEHLRDARMADGYVVELQFYRTVAAMAKAEKIVLAEEPGELNYERGKQNGAWKRK